jgi:signal transduction histidine kinase/CheY-like chemotaxis protein
MKEVHRLLLVGAGEQQQASGLALREAGYDLTACGTVREALVALRAQHCDVLLAPAELSESFDSNLLREAAALCPGLAIIVLGATGRIEPAAAPAAAVIEHVQAGPGDIPAAVSRVLERRALWLDHARLVRELADSRRQLEEVRAEFDRFAGRLAHDLQAVVQVTEGFATALSRTADAKLDARERHFLERIAVTSARGNRLVHHVQAYARLGVHPIEQRPAALGGVLRRAQGSVQSLVDGREVEWIVDELPTVTGDASLLQQVLVDLLTNALYATRERAKAVIRIESASTAAGCEIRVGDNGSGYETAAAEQLFERLHAGDGNGVGLAHARRIVERHGGRMRAESRPGAGALFAFTLPLPSGLGEQAPARQPPPVAPSPHRLRVLLVDDDPMVRLSLTNMVELDGHHVDSVATGQAALEAFERALAQGQGYDAVITDLGMPHMDGGEVARRVRQASPRVRVILLTGWGSHAASACEDAGQVDVVLAKPPRLAQLREALAPGRPA